MTSSSGNKNTLQPFTAPQGTFPDFRRDFSVLFWIFVKTGRMNEHGCNHLKGWIAFHAGMATGNLPPVLTKQENN